MKYTITHTAEWVLLAILALLCIYTAYKAYQLKHDVEYITTTDTITVTDTITNWQPQYIKEYRTDTAYLPIIEEKLDTITKVDTVLVEIPLNTYKWDTSIVDSNYETNLKLTATGYDVTLDTVVLNTNIHYNQPIKIKEKWYDRLGVGVGVMYGTGGAGVGVGIMYKL